MAYPSIYMKKVALTVLAAATLVSFGPSCAKHGWEETQVLHEGMHKDHGDAKHDDHGKADAHVPAAGHEEKKAAH